MCKVSVFVDEKVINRLFIFFYVWYILVVVKKIEEGMHCENHRQAVCFVCIDSYLFCNSQ